jgi:protein-tyrosine-phosphatase/DNA-binding transcriptional ArsR family regulator
LIFLSRSGIFKSKYFESIYIGEQMNSTSLPPVNAPDFFKLLAHDIRWSILQFLAHSDYSGQELVRRLKQPQNLVSYHLRLLAEKHVVTERRSSADERSIYYSLDVHALRTLYFASGDALHPTLGTSKTEETALQETVSRLPQTPVRVLFLCTQNSARSQMAEGIMRHLSAGHIEVMSAGSHPSQLNPCAVRACAAFGIDISAQRSKHIDELSDQSFDYIITVCDRVRESCPTFPGDPDRIHWSFLDPASVEGPDEERYQIFKQTGLQLMTRIRSLLTIIEREKGKAH